MSRLFVACELGEQFGRVMLGALHKDQLTMSEVHRFENVPVRGKDGVLWDVARLHQDMMSGLRDVGRFDEPVDSISCSACSVDYLLFDSEASLMSPTYHHGDPRTAAGQMAVLSKISWEAIYEETGVRSALRSVLFQVGAEKPRRLKHADLLIPIADGFNYLLSGVPCVELSSASAMQLYNPVTQAWSEKLLKAVELPPNLLPPVILGGTRLKPLRPEIAQATGLESAQVVASCSNELTASLVALPAEEGEPWACLRLGRKAVLSTELAEPLINGAGFAAGLSHTMGCYGAVYCHLEAAGFSILEECRRAWADTGNGLDEGVLTHLAATAPPLESLVNLADPQFAMPGDLLAKVQAFCRDTGQTVPRKPGPIYRCLLESLALLYRKTLDDFSRLTGREFTRVFLMGDTGSVMLHHFIANALQRPVVIAPPNAAAIGNVAVQALAMGHIKSLPEVRQIVRNSFKMPVVLPHPSATWAPVYRRFMELSEPRSMAAHA